jgi:hypothetical protein
MTGSVLVVDGGHTVLALRLLGRRARTSREYWRGVRTPFRRRFHDSTFFMYASLSRQRSRSSRPRSRFFTSPSHSCGHSVTRFIVSFATPPLSSSVSVTLNGWMRQTIGRNA